MAEKKTPFRYLTQGADNASLTDSGEPLGLPVPTLEERVRLFLRAVHGERDFTSSEHTEAHGIILKGMAADIAAKSNSRSPEEPAMKPAGPITDSRYGPAPNVAMSASRFEDQQPMYPNIEDAQISSAFEDRPAVLPAAARREHPVQMSRAPLEVALSPPVPRASVAMATRRRVPGARLGDSLSPFPAPAHKPAKRRVFVWATALSIFTGLSVLGGLALYQMATRSVTVTAQSTPGGTPQTAAPDLVQPRYGANAMRPAAQLLLSRVRPAPKNLERARTVIAAGDIEAVRLALGRMIESGNASAAVDLGSTYDPNILDALGVRNFPPDVAKARIWYQKAQQMGSPDAAGLLDSLERSERPSR
jgi:TPR repeat protein